MSKVSESTLVHPQREPFCLHCLTTWQKCFPFCQTRIPHSNSTCACYLPRTEWRVCSSLLSSPSIIEGSSNFFLKPFQNWAVLLPSFSLLSRGLPRRQSRLTVLTTSSHLPTFYVSKNFKLTLQETRDIYLCPPFLPLSMDVPVPSAGSQSSAVTNTHTLVSIASCLHMFLLKGIFFIEETILLVTQCQYLSSS